MHSSLKNMFNNIVSVNKCDIKKPVLLCFLLTPILVSAAAPSQEFLEYLADYGDESGNVIDPVELDQLLSINNEDVAVKKIQQEPQGDEAKLRSAEMKVFKSASQSSSSLKGESL